MPQISPLLHLEEKKKFRDLEPFGSRLLMKQVHKMDDYGMCSHIFMLFLKLW